MYTHCPNCDTHFEISQEYLDIANGKVRCGKCDFIFNALDNLYEADDKPEQESLQNDTLENNTADTPPLEDIESSEQESDIQTPEVQPPAFDTPFEFDSFKASIPSTDIKEKMERIAASLSAATAELKSARQSTTFHKSTAESLFPAEQQDTSETINTTATDDLLTDAIISKTDELSTAESNDLLTDESSSETGDLSTNDDIFASDELLTNESNSETDDLSTNDDIFASDELLTDESSSETDDLSINDDIFASDKLITDKSSSETDDLLTDKVISRTDDELEIIDFTDNDTAEPEAEYTPRSVDEGDIDILNSLMDDVEQHTASTELLDELDDINKTLADSNSSLDDEFSKNDDSFDDLDSGDDLLAELEQLESDFRKDEVNSNSNLDASDEHILSIDGNLPADGSSPSDGSLPVADGSLPVADGSSSTTETSQANSKSFQEEVVPSFLTQSNTASSSPAAMLGWFSGTIILILLLGAQYLHFNSVQFAQNPEFRPLLETLCPITGCTLPLVKTPGKIITVSHDVRSHPEVSNALEVQLSFKNKAAYTQAYPIVEITFSNPSGEVIARRKFLPEEYLSSKDKEKSRQGLKPNQVQEINLKIVDPDPGSLLSFQFNYR